MNGISAEKKESKSEDPHIEKRQLFTPVAQLVKRCVRDAKGLIFDGQGTHSDEMYILNALVCRFGKCEPSDNIDSCLIQKTNKMALKHKL